MRCAREKSVPQTLKVTRVVDMMAASQVGRDDTNSLAAADPMDLKSRLQQLAVGLVSSQFRVRTMDSVLQHLAVRDLRRFQGFDECRKLPGVAGASNGSGFDEVGSCLIHGLSIDCCM